LGATAWSDSCAWTSLPSPTIALYYFVFLGLYAALRRTQAPQAALATALGFVGATLSFAKHSALSMLHLSDRYTGLYGPARGNSGQSSEGH
jgi:hypothetical protein